MSDVSVSGGLRAAANAAEPAATCPIVAVACSAGGLEASRAVLSRLPADFPAAVIVLQHVSPRFESRLAGILARRTPLQVETAVDGEQLRPGRVIVTPSGRHLIVGKDDRVALVDTDGLPLYRPSADLLFTSLALVGPERTIAVILSGSGHDGATGAAVLHRFGGIVVVADPASSEAPSMPQSAIDRGAVVDHVLPVGDIAVLLVELVRARSSTVAVATA